MKINGIEFKGPNVEIIPIMRNGEAVILKAQAVLDYEEFDKLCQRPQPPSVMLPGGKSSIDLNDKQYVAALLQWQEQRAAWLYLKSLSATEGLEWETIDITKPETWENFDNELRLAFTDAERMRIINGIMNAQGFDSDKVEEARKRFLASQEQEQRK